MWSIDDRVHLDTVSDALLRRRFSCECTGLLSVRCGRADVSREFPSFGRFSKVGHIEGEPVCRIALRQTDF